MTSLRLRVTAAEKERDDVMAQRDDVMARHDDLVSRHGVLEAEVEALSNEVQQTPEVVDSLAVACSCLLLFTFLSDLIHSLL